MRINRVTITGADDTTDPLELVSLSQEFPFVEWAILVSSSQEGSVRFPSREWTSRFSELSARHHLRTATHLCGKWVRELLRGDLNWSLLPSIWQVSGRIQINTHAEAQIVHIGMFQNLTPVRGKELIFQLDGANDFLAYAALGFGGFRLSGLLDTSHGAGISPSEWPAPPEKITCGFAGGIGPANVLVELYRINKVCPRYYETWIDMEACVRTDKDFQLDLKKVRSVLEQVKTSGWLDR